jgi:hypothetical protein
MRTNTTLTVLALAFVAVPLSAQVKTKHDQANRRAASATVIRSSDGTVVRRATNIPPGQLPPKGLCRVWIDGVAPGLQPAVTDCATAERTRVANSVVIYGDRDTFPGRGKNKFTRLRDTDRSCTVRDAVVIDGRVVDVCRDDRLQVDRRDRTGRRDDLDDDDDDDKLEKADKREKNAAKALKRSNKEAAKAAKKAGKGR